MNKDKLVAYLQTFHDDRDDAQFVEEKQLIIDTLRALEYVSMHMRMYIGVPRPLFRCEAHLLSVVTLPTLSRLRCTAAPSPKTRVQYVFWIRFQKHCPLCCC